MAKHQSAAIITIRDAAKMSVKGRRSIAAWMRKQAMFFERYAKELSPRFTARYLYR